MLPVAHTRGTDRLFEALVVHQLLNVITRVPAGEEGDACFLIKSRKRGAEDGAVLEGTSLIVGDVSPCWIGVIN